MKDLVEFLAVSLVDNPEEVHVVEVQGQASTEVELAVAADDMGRIIGRGGRVINAIRALVKVRAVNEGRRVDLELLEADELA